MGQVEQNKRGNACSYFVKCTNLHDVLELNTYHSISNFISVIIFLLCSLISLEMGPSLSTFLASLINLVSIG